MELSRLLIERPRVLILDEPNSALNEAETRRLFGILRELSADGITIIYVSHRLEEVFDIADRITVMRNGGVVMTVDRADGDHGPGRGGHGRHLARTSSSRPGPSARRAPADAAAERPGRAA